MPKVKLYWAELDEAGHGAQHNAGRALLARAMRDAGLPPELPVAAGEYGKPCLPDAPQFHFSISHSGTRVVCAVGDAPIGVDLERERVLRYDIAPRVCTEVERASLRTNTDLFALWVGKEAAVKAVGMGLHLSLRTVAVGLDEAAQIDVGGTTCFLRRVPLLDGWHLAVCRVGTEPFTVVSQKLSIIA